jgi:hypothetical protein
MGRLAFLKLYFNHIRIDGSGCLGVLHFIEGFPALLGSEGGRLQSNGIVYFLKLLFELKGALVERKQVEVEGQAVPAVVVRLHHAFSCLFGDDLPRL